MMHIDRERLRQLNKVEKKAETPVDFKIQPEDSLLELVSGFKRIERPEAEEPVEPPVLTAAEIRQKRMDEVLNVSDIFDELDEDTRRRQKAVSRLFPMTEEETEREEPEAEAEEEPYVPNEAEEEGSVYEPFSEDEELYEDEDVYDDEVYVEDDTEYEPEYFENPVEEPDVYKYETVEPEDYENYEPEVFESADQEPEVSEPEVSEPEVSEVVAPLAINAAAASIYELSEEDLADTRIIPPLDDYELDNSIPEISPSKPLGYLSPEKKAELLSSNPETVLPDQEDSEKTPAFEKLNNKLREQKEKVLQKRDEIKEQITEKKALKAEQLAEKKALKTEQPAEKKSLKKERPVEKRALKTEQPAAPKKKKGYGKFILLGIALLLLVVGIVFKIYMGASYKPVEPFNTGAYTNLNYQLTDNLIEVRNPDAIYDGRKTGIIFYSALRVDGECYLPLMTELALKGYDCFLPVAFGNQSYLNYEGAESVIRKYPNIKNWVIVGHLQSCQTAATYTMENLEKIRGLVFLGGTSDVDMSSSIRPMLSIRGSNDLLTTEADVDTARKNYSQYTLYLTIEGANNSGFLNAPPIKGDGEATLSHEDQLFQIKEQIGMFISRYITG